jgi:hypothetical protein
VYLLLPPSESMEKAYRERDKYANEWEKMV